MFSRKQSLREKYPYAEFFWSIFSCIWTEFLDLFILYSVQVRENTDQKNSVYGHFSSSDSTWQQKFYTKSHTRISIPRYYNQNWQLLENFKLGMKKKEPPDDLQGFLNVLHFDHYDSLPITARCCFPIPPENIGKLLGFLMFSGGIEKEHRAAMA